MKKLSTFQIALLIIFGAFAIAGILIFAFAIGGNNSNSVGPVVIWGTLDKTAFTAVIRQAADSNSALSQVSYVQQDPATYEQNLTQALAAGRGPDLFLLRSDSALKDSGEIAPIPVASLSASQFQSAFVESADPYITSSGILGIPILADPLVLYWNKDMLASAGFSQPPQYWDELFTMAQQMSEKDQAGNITQSAVALGEYQNIDDAKDILATLFLQAGVPITTLDTSGKLVSALLPVAGSTNQAAQSALRFYTEFADPSSVYYSWNRSLPEASQAFAAGDLALYIGYASEAPSITRANPNLNYAIAPVPQIRNAQTSIDTAHVYAFAASRTGANPAAAITAAYLLASAANSQNLSTALGIPSARRDVLANPAQGTQDLFNREAIIGHSWLDPDPGATAQIFQAMIEDTTSGAILLADAIQRADQQITHLLGN